MASTKRFLIGELFLLIFLSSVFSIPVSNGSEKLSLSKQFKQMTTFWEKYGCVFPSKVAYGFRPELGLLALPQAEDFPLKACSIDDEGANSLRSTLCIQLFDISKAFCNHLSPTEKEYLIASSIDQLITERNNSSEELCEDVKNKNVLPFLKTDPSVCVQCGKEQALQPVCSQLFAAVLRYLQARKKEVQTNQGDGKTKAGTSSPESSAQGGGTPAAQGDAPAGEGGSPTNGGGSPAAQGSVPAEGGNPATQGGGSPATQGGGSPATQGGGSPLTQGGGSPLTQGGGSPLTPGGGSPATQGEGSLSSQGGILSVLGGGIGSSQGGSRSLGLQGNHKPTTEKAGGFTASKSSTTGMSLDKLGMSPKIETSPKTPGLQNNGNILKSSNLPGEKRTTTTSTGSLLEKDNKIDGVGGIVTSRVPPLTKSSSSSVPGSERFDTNSNEFDGNWDFKNSELNIRPQPEPQDQPLDVPELKKNPKQKGGAGSPGDVETLNNVVHYNYKDESAPSGHFMAYFVTAVVLCVAGYVIYHNKQKIFAIALEGRREGQRRRPKSGGDGGSSTKYSKLQSSVEEVVPSLEKSTTSKNYIY